MQTKEQYTKKILEESRNVENEKRENEEALAISMQATKEPASDLEDVIERVEHNFKKRNK